MDCHILTTHVSAKIIPLVSMPVVLSTQQQHQEKLVLGYSSRSADIIDLGFFGENLHIDQVPRCCGSGDHTESHTIPSYILGHLVRVYLKKAFKL